MNKILVLPVKNEAWILDYTLACASLWADHIIVADQQSTDGSRVIYKKFPKVVMIENPAQYHASDVRKLLLDEARKIEGQNVIFSFDADEVPTGHILNREFWQQVESLKPGTSIQFEWINLWRSPGQYRVDDSVNAPAWKHFGFIDDRKVSYTTLGVINDHTSRIPLETLPGTQKYELPKVLHYQFANWQRTIYKQVHYRMTEWVQKKQTWWNALKINLKYFPTKDERTLKLTPVPPAWMTGYEQHGIPELKIQSGQRSWHEDAIAGYLKRYSADFFTPLDIWDAELAGKFGARDPRGMITKLEQSVLPAFYRVYRKLR